MNSLLGMFYSARLKLTLWYLCTIMAISVLFSVALYFSFTAELERSFARAKVRVLAEEHGITLPIHWRQELDHFEDPRLQQIVRSQLLSEDLKVAKDAMFWQLFTINVGLAFFATFAGWVLAGKTLSPLQRAHEDQKRFIADASHELRTPVTALKTLFEVFGLQQKHTNKEVDELVDTSLQEVDNLQYLVDKLLRLTLYQGSRTQLSFTTFPVQPLVKQVIKLLKPLADEKGLRLLVDGKVGELQADKEKIKELLTILVDNAIKYTTVGSVTVTMKPTARKFVFFIQDTGSGIEQAALPHIFDRFFRADRARTHQQKAGFGLGLAVAKEIVELHGGSIQVSSSPDKGTTFRVSLPISQT